MAAVLAPISGLPRFRNGRLVEDAKAYFYDAGTTTPRTVYQDAGGSSHENPVEVLGDGNFPAIYVQGTTAYKIRVLDGNDVLLAEYDQLQGEVEDTGGGGGGGEGTTVPTGFEMLAYASGVVSGWVRENGRTIGSGASGATERANDDVEDLFLHLWGVDSNLAVSGGRGASGAADWAANKTIALPDARGRILAGLDDMGSTAAGRLAGGLFAFGAATTLGSYGGAATHTLTEGQLAAHTHTASTASNGAHTHTGTTSSNGTHTHTTGKQGTAGGGNDVMADLGSSSQETDAAGAHTHTFTTESSGAHTHTVTVDSAGSGAAHNNLQPFTLRTVYIKL